MSPTDATTSTDIKQRQNKPAGHGKRRLAQRRRATKSRRSATRPTRQTQGRGTQRKTRHQNPPGPPPPHQTFIAHIRAPLGARRGVPHGNLREFDPLGGAYGDNESRKPPPRESPRPPNPAPAAKPTDEPKTPRNPFVWIWGPPAKSKHIRRCQRTLVRRGPS